MCVNYTTENPHATVESSFHLRFSVNVCYRNTDDHLLGLVVFEGCFTVEAYLRFMQKELPRLLEDVPLNKRGRMYFQNNGASPRFSRDVRNFLNDHFLGRCTGRGGLYNWQARPPAWSPLHYCVWGWMKEMTHSVKSGTRAALLGGILDAVDRMRDSQRKLQRATRCIDNRTARCVEAEVLIFEHQFQAQISVKKLS